MAIYDTMQYIRSPVHTVGMGMAGSMASLLLAAGEKGKRFALPNCRIMIHQPHGGAQVKQHRHHNASTGRDKRATSKYLPRRS